MSADAFTRWLATDEGQRVATGAPVGQHMLRALLEVAFNAGRRSVGGERTGDSKPRTRERREAGRPYMLPTAGGGLGDGD